MHYKLAVFPPFFPLFCHFYYFLFFNQRKFLLLILFCTGRSALYAAVPFCVPWWLPVCLPPCPTESQAPVLREVHLILIHSNLFNQKGFIEFYHPCFKYLTYINHEQKQVKCFSHSKMPTNRNSNYYFIAIYFFFLKTLFIYLFLDRGGRREKEKERNINVCLPLVCPPPGTWPKTQACALTGN